MRESETQIYVNGYISRTDVYHTEYCKNVAEIRETPRDGKCMRTDLSVEQVETWGLRECKRCQAIRDEQTRETRAIEQ